MPVVVIHHAYWNLNFLWELSNVKYWYPLVWFGEVWYDLILSHNERIYNRFPIQNPIDLFNEFNVHSGHTMKLNGMNILSVIASRKLTYYFIQSFSSRIEFHTIVFFSFHNFHSNQKFKSWVKSHFGYKEWKYVVFVYNNRLIQFI